LSHPFENLDDNAWAFKDSMPTSMCVRHFFEVARLVKFSNLVGEGEKLTVEAQEEVENFLKSLNLVDDGIHPINDFCYKNSTYELFSLKHPNLLNSLVKTISLVNVSLLYNDAYLFKTFKHVNHQIISIKLVNMKKKGGFYALGQVKSNELKTLKK